MIRKMILPTRLKLMFESKLNNWLLGLALFVAALVIQSCNKDENTLVSYNYGIETSQQYVYAQQMMTQIMATYFKAINDSILYADFKAEIDGATVYLKLDETPNKLRIEYPVWGTSDGYGHWRQGVYEAYALDGYQVKDALIDFRFIDFRWDKDSLRVDSLKVYNLGKTDGKNFQYSITSPKITLIYEDTTIKNNFIFDFEQTFTMMKEQGTIYTSTKDSIGIYGNLSGTLPSELEFTAKCFVDSSMVFSFSCDWLKEGITQLETLNFPYPATVYFPDPDTCENQFLIIIDNNPFPYPFD